MSGKRTIKEIVEYLRKCPTNTIVNCLVKLAADNLADKLEDASRIEESKHREEVKSLQATIKKLNDALTEQNGRLGNNAAIRKALNVADETANELLSWCSNHYQELNCMGGRLKRALESAANGPWRNCDRFGGDYKMLHTAWFDWTGSPSGQNPDGTVKMTFSEWLLAPAKKGNAKDNETFSHGLTIRDLPQFLSTCSRAVDQEWKKLSPEKRKKIVENIMRRVEEKGVCGRSDTINAKYTPGQFDERAHDHGQSVIDEMRKATGIKDGTAHSVCVTVYIDGYLQFAGADACLGPEVSRKDAKNQAMFILQRMDPEGKMTKGGTK